MHVARFVIDGAVSWGVVRDGTAFPVTSGHDMINALSGQVALSDVTAAVGGGTALDDLVLLAPIADPPQFTGVGLNYRQHAEESGAPVPRSPVTFPFYSSAIANPGQPIELPPFTDQVDWEVELGVVIGRAGRDISPEDALAHVAGYTIVHDVSARDVQMAEGQWSRAKSFDTFKPMGPWITTVDELGSAAGLALKLWVNGELKQSSTTDDLIFNVPALVAFLSSALTLRPGAVISTGTPSGVGFARRPAEYLRPGDTVTLEIEGIGRLSNPVVAAPIRKRVDVEAAGWR